ncbi:competence/damage-inducible protein CinA-like protein [alpha proteobacterium HIMB114]|nr:competence/damage-inducible protein CinA-like protein [alpha proteobacterium HIMB114]
MINKKIINKLIKNKITISVAESCTGGLIASEITSVPNSSNIFNLGLVTYSNQSKEKLLKIKKKNLKKYGAVSAQICKEMVENLFKISKTDLCISTTGIAGPSGGSKVKPVGLVYIGIKFKKISKIYMYNFNKKLERNKIQKKTVNTIFNLLHQIV